VETRTQPRGSALVITRGAAAVTARSLGGGRPQKRYGWWVQRTGGLRFFAAHGYLGQILAVFPHLDEAYSSARPVSGSGRSASFSALPRRLGAELLVLAVPVARVVRMVGLRLVGLVRVVRLVAGTL
jgi:hypothetical protein